ncbi:MAG: hypothetical protein IKH63_01280 [Prevotella sp.]|nr:hypothetical protein [Prevotella sp.]
MKQLTLENFKAFGNDKAILGDTTAEGKPMNILCYGENGAGKSSIYEAIKYVFHKTRIENEKIPPHLEGVQRENAKRQILIDYRNCMSNNPFIITVNGEPISTFDTSCYNVYMIDGADLAVEKQIDVKKTLKSMYLGHHDIDEEVTQEFLEAIIEETNSVLKDFFFEEVTVEVSLNGPFLLKINDDKQNLHSDDFLQIHFNEAKLHLIVLIIALSSIILMAPLQADQKKILVLDDFITSLDTANRSFLYQYITSCFKSYQIIIFTHNTSFYNLCDHFLKDVQEENEKWLRHGIYEYNHKHYIYAKKKVNRINEIETELINNPEKILDIGNEVRQYFEILLHQLTMLLMAGAKEETTLIIKEISQKSDSRFFHIDNQGISDLRTLFKEINSIMRYAPEDKQWEKVKKAINNFNNITDSADKLSENIQAMSIYQKVVLHQSSHGHEGLPNLSEKEIKASIEVMRKIEDTIKKMKIERI